MKQVVLNIKSSKYEFFMELLKSFDFVEVEEITTDSKEEIIESLTQSFKELKQYKEGKLKTISAKQLLDEL
jgi:wobble nucleotide-excising tRNase